MALTSYELILAEISDLFDPLVTANDLQANLDHPPLSGELEGRSPVLSLHFDGAETVWQGTNSASRCYWKGTLFVNRAGHGNANTELLLLQVLTKILQKVRDDVTGATYAEVALATGERIQPMFANIEGQAYRLAEFTLESVTYDN